MTVATKTSTATTMKSKFSHGEKKENKMYCKVDPRITVVQAKELGYCTNCDECDDENTKNNE